MATRLDGSTVHTCGECAHFQGCAWLVQARADWTECDWSPSRFVLSTPVAQPAEHPRGGEDAGSNPAGRVDYRCILADPPWPERGGGKIKRGADRHYPLLGVSDMARTILRSGVWTPAADAHLWLWVTNNHLLAGLSLLEELGFRYVTKGTWAKDRFGLGYYMRGQTEDLLLGVRGSLPPLTRNRSTLLGGGLLPRREHSRKPDEVYEHIEAISPGPRLELFARHRRPGWDAWGNEV